MKVSIVILHFGEKTVTQECVKSLYQHEIHPFSVIVVNNMPYALESKDFSKKDITIINNKKNLGFARGVNIGIKRALQTGAGAVLLLNNDTMLQQPLVDSLVKVLKERKDVGIVAPAIRFIKNRKTLFDLGGSLNNVFGRTSHMEVERIKDKSPRQSEYVSGCCMLIKKEVFEKLGFFDEQFFLYYEDVDFCLRAKKKGFISMVNPSVVIDHALSKSAGKMSRLATYHQIRSAILFGRKYFDHSFFRLTNMVFVLIQVFLFLKANPSGGLGGVKALVTYATKNIQSKDNS